MYFGAVILLDNFGSIKMVQQEKALAIKPDDQRSIPGTHMVKIEN